MAKLIKIIAATALCLTLLLLAGCFSPYEAPDTCTVVFEDNPDIGMTEKSYTVKRFDDLQLTVRTPKGLQITGTDYDNYTLHLNQNGEEFDFCYYSLTLYKIRYSALIRFSVEKAYGTDYFIDGKKISKTETTPHLRLNTLAYDESFSEDKSVAVGWNTSRDGSGEHVGFGSRIKHKTNETLSLYIERLPATAKEDLIFEIEDGCVTVTGFNGGGELVIPEFIDGLPVTKIASGAVRNLTAGNLVLPYSLKTIEDNAFVNIKIENLYIFDSLSDFKETAFKDYAIETLHVNAAKKPVYSCNYFATFADKADRLAELKDTQKIIFFSGSSARFGYDSVAFGEAFPEYEIVNMGVFAYANMQPVAQIVQKFLTRGDIVLSSPELDAIDTQFCAGRNMHQWDFCLVEANYDLLALVDLREFNNVFGAFAQFNAVRKDMPEKNYSDSPNDFDEDGKKVTSPSYNVYGDYIVYRPDNVDNTEFSPGKKAYFNPEHIRNEDWAGLNAVYATFRGQGARVYFTYSPRSALGLSADTTAESIAELDRQMRLKLSAPVISEAETAIMNPLYFYGTDNHLSTNGVKIYTEKVINDLKRAMENGL